MGGRLRQRRPTELAVNTNPDDPTTLHNDSFKAAPVQIIGTPPPLLADLQIVALTTSASAASPASVDAPLTVTWTVENLGAGPATDHDGSWSDNVYLHTTPDLAADPLPYVVPRLV